MTHLIASIVVGISLLSNPGVDGKDECLRDNPASFASSKSEDLKVLIDAIPEVSKITIPGTNPTDISV